jgi:branched-chain amino acid aminotransferase
MDRTVVWCDGRMQPSERPVARATDRGLTGGLGVYESLAVLDGKVFAPTRHLDRLARSAALVGIDLPDLSILRDALDEVAAAGGWASGRLRVTVTAGERDDTPGITVVTGWRQRASSRSG